MKKLFTLALTILTVSTTPFLASAGVDPSTAKGNLQIRMTNSESSSIGLILDIVNVEVFSTKTGWIVLNDYQQTISSLSFTAGEQTLLANTDVPVGEYSKLRITFGSSGSIRSNIHNISTTNLSFETRQVEIPIYEEVDVINSGKVYVHFDLTTSVSVSEDMYVLKPNMEEIIDPVIQGPMPEFNILSSAY